MKAPGESVFLTEQNSDFFHCVCYALCPLWSTSGGHTMSQFLIKSRKGNEGTCHATGASHVPPISLHHTNARCPFDSGSHASDYWHRGKCPHSPHSQHNLHLPQVRVVITRQIIYWIIEIDIVIIVPVHKRVDAKSTTHAEHMAHRFRMPESKVGCMIAAKARTRHNTLCQFPSRVEWN